MASLSTTMRSLWRAGSKCSTVTRNRSSWHPTTSASGVGLSSQLQQHFSSTSSLVRTPIDVKMTKFQILSDLHLEVSPSTHGPEYGYSTFHITPRAPYLALLGDIGLVAQPDALRQFLLTQLGQFKIVFFLSGNHEPYSSSWEAVGLFLEELSVLVSQRRKEGEELGEFVPLDRTRYDIKKSEEGVGAVTVLGCTLHSHVPDQYKEAVTRRLNDFYRIKDWTVEDHNRAHDVDKKWLNQQLGIIEQQDAGAEDKRKVVVFTHHSPTADKRANDPRHQLVEGWEATSSAFRTDLSQEKCWRSDRVKLWAFGHTHFNCDFWVDDEKEKGKRVCTNQKGYGSIPGSRGLSPGFDIDKVVEV
ncbi:hypothetical protein QBC40DRAFT_4390 [Triangularia verruculosa]|uniref:Calcineurin-like phosphoesterase domain-containing protein n=1 Tax=Triangularia verruculosa TaxID=2587418 RepID=A0AAN6XC38_9PEZI|nr:hypothetical protein QBC40DRAFT_4390 [Triangularia verruculosa]